MAQYSEAEVKAFQAKDKRISKLSCLSTAAEAKLADTAEGLVLEAGKLLAWVYDETPVKDNVVSDISHPTPTQPQLEALKKVEQETKWTVAKVWAQFQRFPDMSNVDACIRKIKENA